MSSSKVKSQVCAGGQEGQEHLVCVRNSVGSSARAECPLCWAHLNAVSSSGPDIEVLEKVRGGMELGKGLENIFWGGADQAGGVQPGEEEAQAEPVSLHLPEMRM